MIIKTVIFDLDGTITQPFFDFDAIRLEAGLASDSGPILEAMEKMPPEERKRVEEILHKHEKRAVDESALNDGARETLQVLGAAGINVGILTRNLRGNALAIAEKYDLKFGAIVDRLDGPVKPDAFGVLELCRQFDSTPGQTLVVGDFLYDLLSAKAAGAIAVLIKNRENTADFSQHADFTITRLDEILEIIENTN